MNRSEYQPSPPADVRVADDGRTLVFVRDFPHPVERVWTALTEPDHLAQWSPFEASGPLSTPGPVTLTMIDGDDRVEQTATVLRVEPPHRLEYDWGTDRLVWELAPIPSGTRLTLHHRAEDASWLPKLAAGWHICLDVAAQLLAGDPVPPIRGQEAKAHGWTALHDSYARTLGMETGGDEG